MKLSENQKRAVEQIKEITDHFGKDRWFTQTEVIGIGYHTMEALVNKGLLKTKDVNNLSYYQVTGVDIK
jgi:hypothetical protein